MVATGVNAADGSVALSPVEYTYPGTHRYTLHEVGGGTVANGVTYDGATYTVVATVKDNGDGTLSVAMCWKARARRPSPTPTRQRPRP